MMIRSFIAAFVVATLLVAAQAQEKPASDNPFKVEVGGSKLEEISFKAERVREFKRATPRELALEFAFAVNQESDTAEGKALQAKCDALIREFLHRKRCEVIDESLVNKLEAGDKAAKEAQEKERGSKPQRKVQPPVVSAEEKQPDGKVLVQWDTVVEITNTDEAGKTSTDKQLTQQRVLCVKLGDVWAVEKHELFETDWKAEGDPGKDPPKKWTLLDTLKTWFAYKLAFNQLDFKVESATAEAAARTILAQMGGFGAEFGLFFFIVGRMAPAFLDVIKPLFAPETWKAAEAEAMADHERKEKEKKEGKTEEKKERAIEKHEKPEEGVEAILFAPENDWAGKHWLKMKKTDKGWRCVELKKFVRKQVFDKEGNMTETWDEKAVERFADLDW